MDLWRGDIQCETVNMRGILMLASDLHLDAADHDGHAFRRDFEAARELGARISINGDVFDAILPMDRKRHHPSVMRHDPERDDVVNQVVRRAVQHLEPYVNQIDVISPGNHERSILKHHGVDLIGWLVSQLNAVRDPKLPPIHQGGYRGYQVYRLCYTRKQGKSAGDSYASHQLHILRHHGRGGAAPVTGGAIDLDRLRSSFEADLFWVGHKHQRIARAYSRFSVTGKGTLFERKQMAVMSAGYKRSLTLEDHNERGDTGDYGETFYNTTQVGAQWVLMEGKSDTGAGKTVGFVRGFRWSVFDDPAPLLMKYYV